MSSRLVVAALVVLGILALAAYGCRQGTPSDLVGAVRTGDVDTVKTAIERDPAAVHTRVYPQGYERVSEQQSYSARTGSSAWKGAYLIHEAVNRAIDPVPMLEVLANGGADLSVRLDGRTLLQIAVDAGNVEAAAWLLDRGADVNAVNDCDSCDERGQTALFYVGPFNEEEITTLLLDRGARASATDAAGRTALHAAAGRGRLLHAFTLCRYGADPSTKDATGKTPYDLALAPAAGSDGGQVRSEDTSQLTQWLKPGGACAAVAATARAKGEPVSDSEARKVGADAGSKDPAPRT